MHLCSIEVAGQQHPRLDLLTRSQQIADACQLDLIGLLLGIGERGIASCLDLLKLSGVNRHAISADQIHGAGRSIALTCIYPIASLRSAAAGQIHGGNGRSLHHAEGQRIGALTDGSGDLPIAVCIGCRNSGEIHDALQVSCSLIASKEYLIAFGCRGNGQGELRQIRRGRQEKILDAIILCKGDLMTVYGSRHRGDICRCGIRLRIENIRPLSTIVDLVVFRRNFRAASRHKVVAHIRSQTGHCKGRLRSGSHGLSAAVVLAAPEYLVILRTQGRRPT